MASVKSNSQRQVSLSLKQTGSRGHGVGGAKGEVQARSSLCLGWGPSSGLPSPAFSLLTFSEISLPTVPSDRAGSQGLGRGGLLLTRDRQAPTWLIYRVIPFDSYPLKASCTTKPSSTLPSSHPLYTGLETSLTAPPLRTVLCRCYLGTAARPPARPPRELGMPRSA